MKDLKFIEVYKGFVIYQNTDDHFVIYGDYRGEKIEVTEETIDKIKILIDYL